MRSSSLTKLVAAVAALMLATSAAAQSADRPEQGIYLTMFRSPATGIELRSGHAAAFLGYYPTVISLDGVRGNANFVRAGATYYLKAQGATPYVSLSVLWSVGPRCRSGALT